MSYDPNDWRTLWPDHATEIRRATNDLCSALMRLTRTTGDSIAEVAAAQWVIKRIEAFEAAAVENDLFLRRPDDDES